MNENGMDTESRLTESRLTVRAHIDALREGFRDGLCFAYEHMKEKYDNDRIDRDLVWSNVARKKYPYPKVAWPREVFSRGLRGHPGLCFRVKEGTLQCRREGNLLWVPCTMDDFSVRSADRHRLVADLMDDPTEMVDAG